MNPTYSSTPKVLLLGDYSNCHRTLAKGLRNLGCDVTQASNGSNWMNCERQIDLSRKPGKMGGLKLYWRLQFGDLKRFMKGFDIVAIHDPNFVELRPERLRPLFTKLCHENGSVFLTSMSTDIAYLDIVSPPGSPLRYSEWFVGEIPSRMYQANPAKYAEWHAPALANYQREVFSKLNGAVSVLYEYQLGMEKILGKEKAGYGGIPIDTSLFQPVKLPEKIDKVKLFLGRDRTRKLMKGSDLLELAARRVVERYPDKAELTIVENRTFSEFIALLKKAHVVLDQIYSYTPASTALMAMSYGLNVVSGAEPEYYDFIGEHNNHPTINAPIHLDPLTETLEQIVLNPHLIKERGRHSREFVEKHNDVNIVAKRFLNFWLTHI